MRRLCVLLVLWVVGCTPAVPPTPPLPPLVGTVQIDLPQTGSIIFAETLQVSGTAANLPAAGFRLLVTGADERVLLDMPIQPSGNAWSATLANDQTGEPMEFTLAALPGAAGVSGDYDVVSVVLAPQAFRPAGAYGTLTLPFEGDEIGGEIIPVFGTASGLFEGTLILELQDEAGVVIAQQIVTTQNPGILDEVPWLAELATNGYLGPAILAAYTTSAVDGSPTLLDMVAVTITDVAG